MMVTAGFALSLNRWSANFLLNKDKNNKTCHCHNLEGKTNSSNNFLKGKNRGQILSSWMGDQVDSGIGLPNANGTCLWVDIRWGYSQVRHRVPYTIHHVSCWIQSLYYYMYNCTWPYWQTCRLAECSFFLLMALHRKKTVIQIFVVKERNFDHYLALYV